MHLYHIYQYFKLCITYNLKIIVSMPVWYNRNVCVVITKNMSNLWYEHDVKIISDFQIKIELFYHNMILKNNLA